MNKSEVFEICALSNVFLIIPTLKHKNLLNYKYMYVFDMSYITQNADISHKTSAQPCKLEKQEFALMTIALL